MPLLKCYSTVRNDPAYLEEEIMKEVKFTCGYCGATYDNVSDRTACELKCAQEVERKEAEAKRAEREKSQAEAKAAIQALKTQRAELDEKIQKAEKEYLEIYYEEPTLWPWFNVFI